jgi:AAA+ ATPase superfamily predicted ATPase
MVFVDRKDELKALEDEFSNLGRAASLSVIYGRRRIGKTELIKKFVSSHEHIYFLATLQSKEEVIEKFSAKAAEFFHDTATMEKPHTSWDAFFKYLIREIKNSNKPIVIAFDEFTYLIQQDSSITSIFQYYWDEHLKDLPVMVILCGSYVGMMESEVLSHKSPLYGRRTIQLYLEELDFEYLADFFPGYSKEERIILNSVLGNIPSYLLRFDPSINVHDNILVNFLDKRKALFADGLILLRDELKEPRNYLSILKAISYGRNTQKEIADHAHLEPALVGKYLDVLRGMKIVHRIVPITEKNPERSKKGIYQIRDNYYNFWLRFVYPFADFVEEGRAKELMNNTIGPNFNSFVGRSFEKLVRDSLLELNKRKKLPAYFERIGPWWGGDSEIDHIALNNKSKEIMFIEVKWSELTSTDCNSILNNLVEKAKKVGWNVEGRKEYFCIVAKKIKAKKLPKVLFLELNDVF